jgi:hypothetical protein
VSVLTRTRGGLKASRVGARVGEDFVVGYGPPGGAQRDDIVISGEPFECGIPTPGTTFSPATPARSKTDTAEKFSLIGQPDKFSDPIWNCVGEGIGGWTTGDRGRFAYTPMTPEEQKEIFGQTLWPTGHEYLANIPFDAKSRVAAMREKVLGFGGGRNKVVLSMRESSETAMSAVAMRLLSLHQPEKRAELLSSYVAMGRDIAKIPEDFARLSEISGITPELSTRLRELVKSAQPMINELKKAIIQYSSEMVTGQGARAVKSALDVIGATGAAIPIVGAVIQAGLAIYNMFAAAEAASEEAWAKHCHHFRMEAAKYQKYTSDLGLPIPWNAFDLSSDWQNLCADVKDGSSPGFSISEALASVMTDNIVRLKCLPPDIRMNIIKWWAHATAMMSDSEVARIFDALGNVGSGSLASDEQVLLVAAPIAAANGLDIYPFAEALWRRSEGWSVRKDLLRHFDKKLSRPLGLDGEIACLKEMADNALQIQWGVLAKDAFVLIDEVKGRESLGLRLSVPSTPGKPAGRSGSIPGSRGGTIPGRSGATKAPAPGTLMTSWSGGTAQAGISDKTKGGIGGLAIIGGIILGGVMLLRGGHA